MKLSSALFTGLLLGFAAVSPGFSAPTPLVNHGDSWRYHKGTNAPPAGWKTVADASLDATWLTGNGGFGYADNTTETQLCPTLLTDMLNKYSTLYMRRTFQVNSAVDTTLHLQLTMDFDDGFIVWLDGNYLTNRFVTGAPTEPANGALANASHESAHGNNSPKAAETYDFGAVGSRLPVGTHVLAIIGLNNTTNSSDLIIVPDLFLNTNSPPPANCMSGSIAANKTWYTSNSPVHVCGEITINPGVTLTIEPGVTVQFDVGVGITIASGGRLLAEGTTNAPILFTRAGTSGSWGNIVINGAASSPETRIAYAHFEFNAGSPCIDVAAGTAFLDHLTFGNPAVSYIHVDGASFIISYCHFPTATAGFELVHGTGGVKTGGHGIFYRNFFGRATGYQDIVDFTGGNRPSQPIVQFFENVLIGGDDDGFDLDGTDAWVEGNIFLHFHKNGGTPDSSSAVSGGNDSTRTSEITIVRNLFFDCDTAGTAKQGNFFTLLNNTIVHQTHSDGIDSTGGVVNVRDFPNGINPTTFGAGFYLEGNIIIDAEQLVRNFIVGQTSVIMNNNLMPYDWTDGGSGNSTANPMLKHIPQLSETLFTSWNDAQVMWDWFSLLPGSPGLGTGPNGTDQGAVIPMGASISGEPSGITTSASATLHVGVNRTGSGIPTAGFPNGSGYVAYKYRLDGGAWSTERPINTAIALSNLADGPHYVEVSGKRDTGLYQDDPLLGDEATITRSTTWTVQPPVTLKIDRIVFTAPDTVNIEFQALGNTGYTIYRRDSLSTGSWLPLVHLDPLPTAHAVSFPDSITPDAPTRFYLISTP